MRPLYIFAFAMVASTLGQQIANTTSIESARQRRLFGIGEEKAQPPADKRFLGFGKGGGDGGGGAGALAGLAGLGDLGGTPLGSYPLWKFHKFQGLSLQPVPVGLDIGHGIPAPPQQYMNSMPQSLEGYAPQVSAGLPPAYEMGTPPVAAPEPYAPPQPMPYPPQTPSYGWSAPPTAGAGWGAPPPAVGWSAPAQTGYPAPPQTGYPTPPQAGYTPPAPAPTGWAPPTGWTPAPPSGWTAPAPTGWTAPAPYSPPATGAGWGAPPAYGAPSAGWSAPPPPQPKCRMVCDDDYASPSYNAYENGGFPAASSPAQSYPQTYGQAEQQGPPVYGTPYNSAGGAGVEASMPSYDQTPAASAPQASATTYEMSAPKQQQNQQNQPQQQQQQQQQQHTQPQVYTPPAVSYEVAPAQPNSQAPYSAQMKKRSSNLHKEKRKEAKARSDDSAQTVSASISFAPESMKENALEEKPKSIVSEVSKS